MKSTKKPASSSKTKKDVTLPKGKIFKVKKRDSSPSAQSDTKKTETRVEIKPAKGRPMLTWVGKKPLRHAIAYPAQLVETYSTHPPVPLPRGERGAQGVRSDWPKDLPQAGLLFHGDNKDVLAWLLANGFRGKVKLIYIDPPFDSGADYVRKVALRGATTKLASEGYTLGEQVQYTDIWTNDNYLQFMYERLSLLKELLAENGSFWLHCDTKRSHVLRNLLDEIFGAEFFQNEIAWQRSAAHSDATTFSNLHDVILFYSKGSDFTFNPIYKPYSQDYIDQRYKFIDPANGKRYMDDNLTATGLKGGGYDYEWKGIRKSWRCPIETMKRYETEGRLHYTSTGVPRLKRYLEDMNGLPVSDIWTDIFPVNSQAEEREDYPTQKPESLIERVMSVSTNPGDIVLDCFLGSGTTAAVAQKLGRRWIGADINKGAIQTTIKRLQGVMQEQADLTPQPPLLKEMGSQPPEPAQLGFAVYRVNDYDLQIQHNEAFNLAVEHLGLTRTKTDTFFDGTLGKKLVKIVPFNHPVTPLDLEEVKNELNVRPEEERDIVVVGLGREYAVEAWLEEWNKLRKQGNIPNRIEVIELRSDPKYGGFFTHEPAKAKVSFRIMESDGSPSKKRGKAQEQAPGLHSQRVEITIDDFISPTILERLKQQNKDNPLFQPQVSDWRSMVDSVMIDSNYDGKVFNITLADVPERKNDLVGGKYVIETKKGATVAVKVTDMLGEEVLVVREL